MRIQDCPATVWGRELIARRPESDYLPIVLGAPHPAVCRLEDWASADSARVRLLYASMCPRVVACPDWAASTTRNMEDVHRDHHEH